ncbi:MAG: hypothetical protein F6K47_31510 [Symploca sp. SIO2E6]|nr:hypothetical protein [Symploca sp. SIO2E6]
MTFADKTILKEETTRSPTALACANRNPYRFYSPHWQDASSTDDSRCQFHG